MGLFRQQSRIQHRRPMVAGSGAFIQNLSHSVSGSVTATSSLQKSVASNVGGSMTAVGLMIKSISMNRSGFLTPVGALICSVLLVAAGAFTPNGKAERLVSKLLGGSVTASGDYTPLLVTIYAIFGSITPSGDLGFTQGKVVNGSLTAFGTIRRSVSYTLASSMTLAGSVLTIATYHFVQYLSGSLSLSGTVKKDANATKAATVSASGKTTVSVSHTLVSAIAAAGTAARQATRSVGGSITISAVVALISVFLKDLGGSIAMSAAIKREAMKPILAAITPAGFTGRTATRYVVGMITASGAYLRVAVIVRTASMTMSAGIARVLTKWAFGVMLPTGKAERMAKFLTTSTIIPAGLASRFGSYVLSIAATIEMSSRRDRAALKRITANLPVSGFPGIVATRDVGGSINGHSDIASKKFTPLTILAEIVMTSKLRRDAFKRMSRVLTPTGQAIRSASRWLSGAITAIGNVFGVNRDGKVECYTDVFVVTRLETRVFSR